MATTVWRHTCALWLLRRAWPLNYNLERAFTEFIIIHPGVLGGNGHLYVPRAC
jgi:hypothetical protein